MSATNGFIISIAPDRLSVIFAKRGRVHQAESIALSPDEWEDHWSGGLMRLDLPLRQLLSRFSRKHNASATLLYHSPSLTKQIYSFDQGGAHARDGARSKIREGIGFSDPVTVCPLGSDQGANQACTMLAFSDREENLRSLFAWLNRCGVRVTNMIPSSVASIVSAAHKAIKLEQTSVLFYFDADISIIAHSHDGNLSLIRPADIGYRKLAESYEQAFKESHTHDEASAHEHSQTVAMDCLFRFGIPFESTDYDGIELRSSVLPCIAPVLQRIGIDIKQTIRFGISSGPTLKNLHVFGPGAVIPNIAKAVGEHLELQVKPIDEAEQYEPLTIGGRGTPEHQLIVSSADIPGLLPTIAEDERVRTRLGRAVVAGTAVAMIAMGGQYSIATMKQNRLEYQILQDQPRLQHVNSFENDHEQAQRVSAMLGDIARLVESNSGQSPMWEHPLAQIGDRTGNAVRILEIRGDQGDALPYILINGYAINDAGIEPGQVLDGFVKDLERIDAVDSVKLGATSRIFVQNTLSEESADDWGLQFTMRVFIETQESPYKNFAVETNASTDWSTP